MPTALNVFLRLFRASTVVVLALLSVSQTVFPQTAPLGDIQAVTGGNGHTCALTTGGGVKCWGRNHNGQLGDNTTTDRLTPVDVSGLGSGVTAISAGDDHTCALTSGGGVKCWGDNGTGALGDNTTTNRLAPVDVIGLTGGATGIAAGGIHTCALTSGGGVKCWGYNVRGALGDNSTTTRLAPVNVVGLSSGVAAVAAGYFHTCAVTSAGGAKCWGGNFNGQLGDNSTTDRLTPVDVSGLASGVIAIAAATYHSCAANTGGGVKCWGSNDSGRLGDNSTTDSPIPVDVSGLSSGVAAIAAGGHHTCALTSAGEVKCWGTNDVGQLGDNSFAYRLTLADVSGLSSGVTAIAAGGRHSCALISGGVKCWGANHIGQLGDGGNAQRLAPVNVSGLASGVTNATAGNAHTCALTGGGGVKCWGHNADGQLGDNSNLQHFTPVDVTGLGAGVTSTVAGWRHSCAVVNGGLKCWGSNDSGQLGDNSTTGRLSPVEVSGLSTSVTATAAGARHACALTSAGGMKCWGENGGGQLGDNSTTDRLTPVDVWGLGSGANSVAAGSYHTCALTSAGAVKCWGNNGTGQLGDNSTTNRQIPVDVWGLSSGVTAVVAGYDHTCALTSGGAVKCWGYNSWGQLGDNTTNNSQTPVDVSGLGSGVAAIAAGWNHTCALMSGGVKCWGSNAFGGLGDHSTTDRLTPVDVEGLGSGIVNIAAGSAYTCAVTSGGGVKCWGYNIDGQLGDGTAGRRPFPGDVLIEVPESPSIGVATASDASASVSFSANGNGGAAIDDFRVTCNPGAVAATGSSSPINLSGLTNGTSYTCTVAAHNSVGWSAESATSGILTPSAATAPSAPQNVTANPGNGQVSVAFDSPASPGTFAGGSPATVTSYTAICGIESNTGSTSPIVVAGLSNGTGYACTITATNNVPLSGPAGTAAAATPRTVPDAPSIGTATAGNAGASVSFGNNGNGGAAIDDFRVTCSPGSVSATGTTSPIAVVGLSNGTSYTCTAAAHNPAGWSAESVASNSFAPQAPTAPGTPTSILAAPGDAQISVAFEAPASSGTLAGGGAATITGYTADCGGTTQTGVSSPLVVTGLTNGTSYACTVTATNNVPLTGPAGTAVAVTPRTLPDAPTIGTATPGDSGVSVSVALNFDGGAPIDSISINCTSSDGGAPGSGIGASSPITASGLTNDKTYTCRAAASNVVGWSAYSGYSNSFTPKAPTAPSAPTIGTATAGNAEIAVVFAASASAGTLAGGAAATITGYTATCGALSNIGAASPIVVAGLTNGTGYSCTVTATNSVPLISSSSAASNSVTPQAPTPPGAPQNVAGTPGNAQISVTFDPPTSSGTVAGGGVATIVSYTASCGSETNTGSASPIVVTGLNNGTSYACTVTATSNAPLTGLAGTGASVTPFTVPEAPGAPTAAPRPRAAALSFAPGGNGGISIDQYKAVCTSSDGGSPTTTYGSASPFTAGLLSAGKTYTCVVAAHNAAGWGGDSPASGSFMVPATALAILPDSGQTTCYDGSSLVACTSVNTGDAAPYPRQDARYGRDAAATNGELTKTGGGAAGFDYTALDAIGNATTPGSGATPHACVRDNLTGLVWEVKTNDGALHDRDHTYTWYSSNAATNGGNAGGLGNDTCGGTLGANCNTEALVNAVNAAGWCGFNDWRMPTVRELQSLVHAGTFYPAIDVSYFPNTLTGYDYWSATSYAPHASLARIVSFYHGYVNASGKSSTGYARLVRGQQ